MENKTLMIVGLGLIGGSLAKASRPFFKEIWGMDASPEVCARALSENVCAKTFLAGDASFAKAPPDVICLCVPVQSAPAVMKELHAACPGALFCDAGSTKQALHAFAARENVRYCGFHPMAGSERSGLLAARRDLFEKAVVCITQGGSKEDEAFITQWMEFLGARTVSISPAGHDAAVGAVSHLPHLVASALVENAQAQARKEPLTRLLAAGGFADITRIAASDPRMWRDIFLDNPSLPGQLENLIAILARWRGWMLAGQGKEMEACFAETRREKESFREQGGIFRADAAEKYGLLGQGIQYSLSPAMHTSFYENLHVNASYALLDVLAEEIPSLLARVRAEFRGINVTKPYKEKVIPFLDALSPHAAKIGSVNTVAVQKGKLTGYSTDGAGFWQAYGARIDGPVLLLGAGGAAAAVALSVAEEGVPVNILARAPEKAQALAAKLAHPLIKRVAGPVKAKVLVNATSAGLTPCLPEQVTGEMLTGFQLVIDTVYHRETELLQLAKSKGIPCENGLAMLLWQAVESARIWGLPVGEKEANAALALLREKLRQQET